MLILTLPVTYSLMVTTMGFDPIWFGVMIVMMCELSLITPPVGMNLYVIQGIAEGIDLFTIAKGVFPFLLVMIGAVALYTFVPDLVLFLPSHMW